MKKLQSEYNLIDIKPIGNFDFLLEKLNDKLLNIESEQKYSSRVANFIKFIVNDLGVLDALQEFNEPYTGWNYEEQKICLLYTHLLIIRANNIAQKYLNDIEMPPNYLQLIEYIDSKPNLKSVFGKLIIHE